MRKTPLDDPALFLRTSSFYQMGKVTTPTLILFGSEDKRVPTEQGWMHYRALQQTGKADVRFVLFPGEGHGPSKLIHIRRALEKQFAWFDKYLFQTAKKDSGDLKADSPLAVALKLKATNWAGGPVNPDDAEKLQKQIHQLRGTAPLLKEVGSFKPSASDQPVFDLCGNVAEWTVTTDGMGKVMGGSADCPADQKERTSQPSPQYIGFRVVRGPINDFNPNSR